MDPLGLVPQPNVWKYFAEVACKLDVVAFGVTSIFQYFPEGIVTTFKVGANGNILIGASIDYDISFDKNGNYAIQKAYALPFSTKTETFSMGLLDAGVAGQVQIVAADSISDLEGTSVYAGGSIGSNLYLGLDMIVSTEQGGPIIGGQGTLGYGYGLDIHGTATKTETIYSSRTEHIVSDLLYYRAIETSEDFNKIESEVQNIFK